MARQERENSYILDFDNQMVRLQLTDQSIANLILKIGSTHFDKNVLGISFRVKFSDYNFNIKAQDVWVEISDYYRVINQMIKGNLL